MAALNTYSKVNEPMISGIGW